MGNNNSYSSENCKPTKIMETLKCDRIIDAEEHIFIGIVSKHKNNPLSGQGIRIGFDGKIKRLENFIETPTNLIYEFENNSTLTLSKRDEDIIINIKEPETNTNLTKSMDLFLRQMSKPINWSDESREFDKISNFVYPVTTATSPTYDTTTTTTTATEL